MEPAREPGGGVAEALLWKWEWSLEFSSKVILLVYSGDE